MFECWKEGEERFKWCWMVEEEKLVYERTHKGHKEIDGYSCCLNKIIGKVIRCHYAWTEML